MVGWYQRTNAPAGEDPAGVIFMLQLWIQYTAALPVWNKEENDENEEDDESDDGSLSGGPDDSLCGVRQKEAATNAVKAARSSTSLPIIRQRTIPGKGCRILYPEGEGKRPMAR